MFSRVALLFAAFASLGALATGCGGGGDEGGDGRLTVVVTVAPVGALVSAVAGSDADVRVLVGPGVDPHDYELKAADRRAVERADVIFRNGLGLDAFLDRALKDSNGTIVTLSDGLMLRAPDEEPHAAGGAHAHEGEDDPHTWHDIDNDRAMVRAIAGALANADPAHETAYRARAEAYDARLVAVDGEIRALIATIPESNRKVVTNHDAIGYFLDRYGLRFVGAVIPGTSTQAEPSSKDVAALVETIRREGVKAIFADSSVDPKIARQVARDTGARIVDDIYGDSLGPAGSEAATVDGMLLWNARKMTEALR